MTDQRPQDRSDRQRVTPRLMRHGEAAVWLKQVGGRAYRNRREPDGPEGWVAVVVTPPRPGSKGRVIVGTGESLAHATQVVERAWHEIWRSLSSMH